MGSMKDLWLAAWEQEYYEALDEGMSERHAQIAADNNADHRARDRLADMADFYRRQKKEAQ